MKHFIVSLFAVALLVHIKMSYRNALGHTVTGFGGCSAVWIAPHRILSAAHCFNQDVIEIWLKGKDEKSFRARLIADDRQSDLALLETDYTTSHYVKLGELPDIGDKVEVVASPGNLGLMYSEGIVEGYVDIEEFGHRVIIGSSMIAKGSSGGPVFDQKGRLIGLAEAIFNSSGGMAAYIPIDIIKAFLKENTK